MKYYLFVCMDNFLNVICGFGFFLILAAIVGFVVTLGIGVNVSESCESRKEGKEKFGEYLRRGLRFFYLVPIGVILITISHLLPSTKQLAAIYLLPKIVENKEIQKLPDNMVKLANEWMEELRPSGERGKP